MLCGADRAGLLQEGLPRGPYANSGHLLDLVRFPREAVGIVNSRAIEKSPLAIPELPVKEKSAIRDDAASCSGCEVDETHHAARLAEAR